MVADQSKHRNERLHGTARCQCEIRDRAGRRSIHSCAREIELRLVQPCNGCTDRWIVFAGYAERLLRLFQIRPRGIHRRRSGRGLRLSVLDVLRGRIVLRNEIPNAPCVRLRIPQLGATLFELRACGRDGSLLLGHGLPCEFELRVRGRNRELERLWIDVEQRVAGLHVLLVAHEDVQHLPGDLCGNLRAVRIDVRVVGARVVLRVDPVAYGEHDANDQHHGGDAPLYELACRKPWQQGARHTMQRPARPGGLVHEGSYGAAARISTPLWRS
jgi:hypothetical protein